MTVRVFRVLRPDDAHLLAMLHAEAFASPWSPGALRNELAKPTVFGLGLLESSELAAGFVSFGLFQRVLEDAEILTLATAPQARSQGHAAHLLSVAFRHLTERGVSRCLLDVAADNSPALALYKKLGFLENGRRKAYYARADAPRVDAILMASELTGL